MEWNQDQIAAVIGSKELEIIGLRMQLAQVQAEVLALREKAAQDQVNPATDMEAALGL